jgi:ferric-dicitrate binding protein FerR (iron transport regulator)
MMTTEITQLLNKYRHHSISSEEFEQLDAWLKQSDENRRLFNLYISYYKIEERYDAFHHADTAEAIRSVKGRYNRYHRHLFIRRASAIAACAVVLLVSASLVYNYLLKPEVAPYSRLAKTVILTAPDGSQQMLQNGGTMVCDTTRIAAGEPVKYNTITTQQGGNFLLTLPDGTKVWLNANTTFRYPNKFVNDRRVDLKGEAFFDVTHKGTPFSVKTADAAISVMGTAFNISAYPSRTMTATLVRGKVQVANRVSKRILAPGQQAVISSSHSDIDIRNVNTDIYTSWITGVFDFDDTSLQSIMEQLSEWYNIEVVYEPESLRYIHFTGSLYRDKSLDYSLDIVQFVSNVRFRKEEGKLIVYKK